MKHLYRSKWIILLTMVTLLLGIVSPVLAEGEYIETDAVFTVSETSATAGEEGVELYISVEDSPEFEYFGFQVVYDKNALTLKDISLASGLTANTFDTNMDTGLANMYWSNAAFPDEDIFVLEFDVSPYAASDSYEIDIEFPSHLEWLDVDGDIYEGQTTVPGAINVTGSNVATIGSTEYESLGEALAAAIDDSPATITMLANAMIENEGDRIVIPSGAEITLDMNGRSIASALEGDPADAKRKPVTDRVLDKALIEVKAGGKLNIVDNSSNRDGSFIHSTGDLYTVFLINSGTLNMENIAVNNFYDGIRDGSYYSGGSSGTYGTIADCTFTATETAGVVNYQKTGINIGSGQADIIDNCVFHGYEEKGARSVDVGGLIDQFSNNEIRGMVYIREAGTVNNFINNNITHLPDDDDFAKGVDVNGSIGLMEDNNIKSVMFGVKVFIDAQIDEIKSGKYEAKTTGIENSGRILEISGGEFYSSWDGHGFGNEGNGVIDLISGGEFKAAWYVGMRNAGEILEINGGQFLAGNYGLAFRNSGGTINSISGGTFSGGNGSALFNDNAAWSDSVIVSITGGLFISNDAYALEVGGGVYDGYSEISEISGGTFISNNSSAIRVASLKDYGSLISFVDECGDSKVGEIKGGIFIGHGEAAVRLFAGTIETISEGIFIGNDSVLKFDGTSYDYIGYDPDTWDDVYENVEYDNSVIENIQGGYYKLLLDGEIIEILSDGADWFSDEGYDFATVPLREQDLPAGFPDEELIEDQTGFYHFGETVDITWAVEGQEDEVDMFVIGDPVYYNYEEPTKETENGTGYDFAGWNDGENTYPAGESLAVAVTNITYTAEFQAKGPERDYKVSLATEAENLNPGDEFDVDVIITSESNESFAGATIKITYDNTIVDYTGSTYLADNFNVTRNPENGITTLQLTGASGSDYEMTDKTYKLATLGFEVNRGIANGETTLGIKGDPVVNQRGAVQSVTVDKGEDIDVSLWNITVTFKAGTNVSLDPGDAKAYVKYGEAGLWTADDYETGFEEPVATADEHYTLTDPLWKPESGSNVSFGDIEECAFTADAQYAATASANSFNTELPDSIDVVSGVEEGKATYGVDVVFTVDAEKTPQGYKLDEVSYTVGDGEAKTLTADAQDQYTIPGVDITGDVEVNVSYLVDGEVDFISFDDYKALPTGYQVLKLFVDNKLNKGAYEYDGEAMFYSSAYSEDEEHVYLYIISDDVTDIEALADIKINPEGICYELAYDGDVNRDKERDSTDALLTFDLYNSLHVDDDGLYGPDADSKKATLRMRLEADVNGDKVVDTQDAQEILNWIWK